jgi:hypothetical protein
MVARVDCGAVPDGASPDAFYVALGDGRFVSTEHTGGPWDPSLQHGGPPSALLARAIETMPTSWPGVVIRMSVDILGPVPVAEVALRTEVLRSGRSVELVQAELAAGGRVAVRATAWRVRAARHELPDRPEPVHDVPPFPAVDTPSPPWPGGYLRAMQWRIAGGGWSRPGPATVWARMRLPLVAGEQPTGLQRVMVLADSGNGVSNVLPQDDWLFINPDLTVHLAAEPEGEWICLDAATTVDEHGFGLASSRLFDRERLVGRGAQALFVAPRG